MTSARIAASRRATARELGFYMTLGNISGIPITEDDGSVVGIVSEQDVIHALRQGCDLATTYADEIMTREVITVTFDTTMEQLLEIFDSRHVLSLPVVQDGKLVGMVARSEVLRAVTRAHSLTWVA